MDIIFIYYKNMYFIFLLAFLIKIVLIIIIIIYQKGISDDKYRRWSYYEANIW